MLQIVLYSISLDIYIWQKHMYVARFSTLDIQILYPVETGDVGTYPSVSCLYSCTVSTTWKTLKNIAFSPKYDFHTKFYGELICHFEIIVTGVQNYQRMTLPNVHLHQSVSIIIQPMPTSFGWDIDW